MMLKNLKKLTLFNIMKKSFYHLPTPLNISFMWNFGFMLGICLTIQILTGLFLAMQYSPNIIGSFSSVIYISRDVNWGWLLRNFHSNGASMFFICIYLHVGRGLYYMSYFLFNTWTIGIIILLLTMASAFLGYVLPWGQMSFWGATVITNLLSAIPYIGNALVKWLWGGFSVSNPTLNRFFVFHFILPFFILFLVVLHLMFLHEGGSSNLLGVKSNTKKIRFQPYYMFKDMLSFMFLSFFFFYLVFFNPFSLSDPDNFIKANPMVTPIHIQPEWYFLFAYAILRSIPNKLGGVIMLFMSIMILFFFMFLKKGSMKGLQFYPFSIYLFWFFTSVFFMLTFLGSKPIEEPYILMSQILTFFYFSYFFFNFLIITMWDKLIF